MKFDLWGTSIPFSLEFPLELPSLVLSAIYLGLFLWMLWKHRSNFLRMGRREIVFFGISILLVLPLHALAHLSRRQIGMVPASPVSVLPATANSAVSLSGLALIATVAVWLGPAPGLIINLIGGLAWAWFHPLTFTDLLALTSWGFTIGLCLHQPYKGGIFRALRRPLVALPVSAFVLVLFLSISRLIANLPPGILLSVDYFITIWNNELPLWISVGLGLGIFFQVLFLLLPEAWRPPKRADVVSIYSRSLRIRFMIIVIPLVLLSFILSVFAVTARAITLAREQSLAEMHRSATNAGDGIIHFYYTSLNLLSTFAEDPSLLNPEQRLRTLEIDRQVVPFFQELLLVNTENKIVEGVPQGAGARSLTMQELAALQDAMNFGISQVTHLTLLPSGDYGLTVVQPIAEEELGLPSAFLLGRVQLDVNPEMRRALEALQSTRGIGAGFILDDRGLIIAHPNPEFILRPWESNEVYAPRYPVDAGIAYEDVADAQRVLIHHFNVEGTPYTVVLQLPFSAVLETAAFISSPLLIIQFSIGLLLLFAIPFFATRITKPLNTLSEAANHIARGNLGIPVVISGDDEVAQLGNAFEQMRLRLRARLNDLSLLLSVAQNVSATLDLERGVPPILEGALEETGAAVARFVLLSNSDRPQRIFAVGDKDPAIAQLDRAFSTVLSRRREPLIIQNLAQSNGTPTGGGLQSVAVFPVRTQNSTVAILWVGSRGVEAFDEARVNFLSTLASQAAVLVENARLFQAAEGGRRRLAAILASTSDAILVTDSEGHLLLINPAAQRVLGLDESSYGRSLENLEISDILKDAIQRSDAEQHPPSVEVPMDDGLTFYASIAPILGAEGLTLGKVVVMRDVTHFKELDEMKSDFVATVSHDLRAPLTFIRGYATMLMMVGDLNDKQHDYLERILEGIDQMSALIGDLLNLRRIEAGVGIRQESCRLGLILVEAVDTMRARATTKGIMLRLEPSEGAPTVIGDRTLLRQALGNLVDNAIKYTPTGGQVRVGLDVNEHEVVLRVSDTGLGIAPDDQVRLFEKFYRIKRRETGNIQGTGLGLALVKSIVERHGGRVWVESVLNQGSTFYIALPLPEDEALVPEEE